VDGAQVASGADERLVDGGGAEVVVGGDLLIGGAADEEQEHETLLRGERADGVDEPSRIGRREQVLGWCVVVGVIQVAGQFADGERVEAPVA
jgi:hypothetical protein